MRELGAIRGKELLLTTGQLTDALPKFQSVCGSQSVSRALSHIVALCNSIFRPLACPNSLSLSPLLSFTLARDDSSAVFAGASPSSPSSLLPL